MHGRAAVMVALAAALAAGSSSAQQVAGAATRTASRWWGGVGAGVARLSSDQPPLADRGTAWRLDFFGGVKATPQVWLGLKLGGFGLEAGNLNDPAKGEGVGQCLAVVEVHAPGRSGTFAAAGAGWSSYTNGDPEWFDHEGDGWAAELAVGHHWPVGTRWALAPTLSFAWGSITPRGAGLDDLEYRALALSVRLLVY